MKTNIIKQLVSAVIVILCCHPSYTQVAEKIEMTQDWQLLGLGKQHILKSNILQEERPIIISLPLGYKDTDATYPVLYVLDGLQNIKHTVGTVELLTESGLISPLIIVGIESLDRTKDLTPSKAGQNVHGGVGNAGIPQSGGAPKFLEFLGEELIPFMDTNYRTHPYRILEGHSLGGLFSVFTLMGRPNLFDAFIVEAPELWWNKEEMTEKGKSFFKSTKNLEKTIYFGIGGGDGWGMRQELIRYVEVIEKHPPKNFRWKHEEAGDEGHMASRLLLNYNGLRFLFSDLKLEEALKDNFNDTDFLSAEEQLKNKYGKRVRRPAEDYMDLVSELVDKGNELGAITVLKRASGAYPMYIGLLTYLARLYEKTGQKEKAIATYLQGVEVSKKYKQGQEKDLMVEIRRLRETNK
ncbi:alpha/beta hydrolase-fold protein [Maribacter sp. PR1]|uniref:Alpha/beta hydrolase-fold protein n=1 Tax=Maribacter cobaltidurans TaxID=1178778 RepID=A0ABU7ITR5_9FLAO|nr:MULTISPECIES: alpha/beta hydrolase-fold protein [Maribacter]MDC6388970.1 alpha/beta hydrolase-fold protein [Maribacter sp. PR1]MEE1976358.1 alpha/beta hydrolase-fold protein [Maribacter cobaltidurans]